MKNLLLTLSSGIGIAIGFFSSLTSDAQTFPVVVTQPVSTIVSIGSTTALSAGVSGDGIAFQWLKDGGILLGQTNSSISFDSFQFTNSGNYQLVATNASGMAITRPASLSVPGASFTAWGKNSSGQLGIGTTVNSSQPLAITSNVVAVSGGYNHTLFLMNDGGLWGMGANTYGQLGNGTTNNATVPLSIASNVVAVAAGNNFSLYVTGDGTLWAMGGNSSGQLGDGTTTNRLLPVSIASNVVTAAAGYNHTLFIKNDGTLWAMGNDDSGQLGDGTTHSAKLPISVASNAVAVAGGYYYSLFVTGDGTLWFMGNGTFGSTNQPVTVASNVVAASAGYVDALFIENDGSLWTMGLNNYGELGNGTRTGTNIPVKVASNVVAVAGGYYHSLFVTGDGALWAMGYNYYGELGNGTTSGNGANPNPIQISGITVASLGALDQAASSLAVAMIDLQAPPLAAQAVTMEQTVSFTLNVTSGTGPFAYQWQLNGTDITGATNSNYTIAAAALSDAGVYNCTVTGMRNAVSRCALLTVYSISGQPSGGAANLGQSITLNATAFNGQPLYYLWLKDGVILPDQTNSSLTFSSFQFTNCGNYQLVATNALGTFLSPPVALTTPFTSLAVWGNNNSGQLGNGTTNNANFPITVASNVVATAAGSGHTLFVTSDGALWAMGVNTYGQLGNGTTNNSSLPVLVASNVVAAAAGNSHSVFVKSDGTLWAMGINNCGQLGNGTTSNTNLPVSVASNVVAVAAGVNHTLFVKSDGTLWAMGMSSFGQLGTGKYSAPPGVAVEVTSNVVAVAAGSFHSLFIKNDGSLWAMGFNTSGQLGIGAAGSTNLPVIVASNVTAVAAGDSHSLFVKTDGTLWAMGTNSSGQLGGGTTNSSAFPIAVASNVVAVAAGYSHSLFAKHDGSLWAVGADTSGQLGDGTNSRLAANPNPVQLTGITVGSLGAMDQSTHSLAVAMVGPQAVAAPDQVVTLGQSAIFAVTVTNGTGSFTYQWQLNGTNLAGATNSSYTITAASLSDAGNYTCAVTGMRSTTLSGSAQLMVISTQPADGLATLGQLANISVAPADGRGNSLTYQWLKDEVVLPGQTNNMLNFNSFQFTNCGNYQLITTTARGLVISCPVTRSISTAPSLAWGWNDYSQLGTGNYYDQQTAPLNVTNNVSAIAAGLAHSLLLKNDGTLWGMGYDCFGELGMGPIATVRTPTNVASDVLAVAAGGDHSLFVQRNGTLWAMGANDYGQVGTAATNKVIFPVMVATKVVAVAAGSYHSLFLKSDGTLWAMGYNNRGQLGDGTTNNSSLPIYITNNVVAIAGGYYHSLFAKTDGTLWAMGYNSNGQLGNGTTSSTNRPVVVATNVVAVAAGGYHSLFIKSDQSLWAMGYNSSGQLGNGTTTDTNRPISVANSVTAVAAGQAHSLFAKSDGSLWTMGYNAWGQLGIGSTANTNRPAQVPAVTVASLGAMSSALHSLAVAAITPQIAPLTNQTCLAGQPVTLALIVTNGTGPFIYQWQFNGANIIGATNSSYSLAAATVADSGTYQGVVAGVVGMASNCAFLTIKAAVVTNQPASAVVRLGGSVTLSAGVAGAALGFRWLKDGIILPDQTNSSLTYSPFKFTNCGSYQLLTTNLYGMALSYPATLSASGAPLQAWGANAYGKLGLSSPFFTNRPVSVANSVVAAAGGANHSLFIKSDGTLWTMGYNCYGQLGNGTTNNSTTPVNVASSVVMVAAGADHSLFIKSDAMLWAMGRNDHGQLSFFNESQQNLPAHVINEGIEVVAVAAGASHSLFLKSDGTLWGMGYNRYGQLGNGTTNDVYSPPINLGNNVVAVAAGAEHSLFLKCDGTLWATGRNNYGQLGIGCTSNTNRAVFVSSNVVGVAAGGYHSLFIKDDSTLWAMGVNFSGQLGIGNTTNLSSPVYVTSNVVAMAGGLDFSLFAKNDGTLWAMGYNGNGELGIGNATQQTLPVQIPGLVTASLSPMAQADHSLAVAAMVPSVVPLGNSVLTVGQGITLTATVTNGTGPFTYQWQFNGTNLPGAVSSAYAIYSVTLATAGTYTCNVSGMVGTGSTTAFLTVYNLSGQPSGGVATNGQHVTLSLAAANGLPLSYQWLKDGVVLTGQTNSTLDFAAFQFTNCGCYLAVLTNAYGMALTQPTSLTVAGAPLQSWGFNNYGQLGTGTTSGTNRPTPWSSNMVAVAAGEYHSVFFNGAGQLWRVGLNAYGQLGSGNNLQYSVPVGGWSNTVAAAAGTYHSLFVGSDGLLWATGDNAFGQIANGTAARTNSPLNVTNNVVTAAAGSLHSLFIRNDGTLWGMGANNYGQLGLGTTSDTNRPAMIASNVIAVAAGGNHSLFIKSDGTLWATGYNNYGQLGIGNTTNQLFPVCVASNVVAAAAGNSHSLFITCDGTVWAMGANFDGQLGIGNTTQQNSPVPGAKGVAAAAAGYNFSLFKMSDGTLWATGDNMYGQLGTGDNSQRKSPVQVSGLVVGSLGGMAVASHSVAVAAVIPQFPLLNNQMITAGQPVTLTLNVTNGTGPYTYQWQFNGTTLADASNSSFSIAAVTLSDAGTYTGIVTDMGGNVSSSATLSVNLPPVPGSSFAIGVKMGVPFTVQILGGNYSPSDPDNDPLTISSVTGATNGIISTDGTNVTYTAIGNGTDSFTYTVSDGRGGTGAQTVNVTISPPDGADKHYNQLSAVSLGGGESVLTFLGTPGFNYALEATTNIIGPNWLPLMTNPAAANGWLIFTDNTTDSPVFYRTRTVP